VRYVIAIPAFLACLFYVYVLVQLRRDEQHYKAPENPVATPRHRKEKLVSFTAVRPLGSSFAQWSRLAKKTELPTKGQKRSQAVHSSEADHIQRSATYIEIGLPLSSGVAPGIDRREDNYSGFSPKKIA
jgi:hypothetical protein